MPRCLVTKEEAERFCALADEGFSLRAVARMVGRSKSTVQPYLAGRLKRPATTPADLSRAERMLALSTAPEAGTHSDLADRFGLASKNSFSSRLKEARVRFGVDLAPPSVWSTPGIIERLEALWRQRKFTAPEIAAQLSAEFGAVIKGSAVLNKLDRIGLGDRRKPRESRPDGPHVPPGTITLPGRYAYRDGKLFRDGAAVEARS